MTTTLEDLFTLLNQSPAALPGRAQRYVRRYRQPAKKEQNAPTAPIMRAKNQAAGVSSLCWGCMKPGWVILCDFPRYRPPGAKVVVAGVDPASGETLQRVVECPYMWPDAAH
ncbi:MAG: hypothetical protein U1D96_03485 [Eubacteriales bacterium]|nr:hypothetical protein [Eubacteriales bacterium]